MQITPTILYNSFLQNVNTLQQQVQNLDTQASTGVRYQLPQDNPTAVTQTIDLKGLGGQLHTMGQAATNATSWLNTSASVLGELSKVWNQVNANAIRASNSTLNATDREAIATQLNESLVTLNQLTSTTYLNSPLFDLGANHPLAYQVGPNATVTVNTLTLPGNPPVNVGTQISNLQSTLTTLIHDVQNGSSVNLSAVQAGTSAISDAQAIIGGRLDRIHQQSSYLRQLRDNLAAATNQLDGANMAKVASQLTLEEQAYQAALTTGSRVLPMSLLNFVTP